MRIGLQFDPRGNPDLDAILGEIVRAEEEGFHDVWLGQVFDHDVLTLLALAGQRTSRIGLGVSVVPLPSRHVTALAQQALSTQLASGNRLCLGVGCGHPEILGKKMGLPNDRPLARTREKLAVLRPLLRGEYVKYDGEFEHVRVGVPVAGAEPPSVVLAALGPRMIELAAEACDGISVVFAGAGWIRERAVPNLPTGHRIVASLPIAVTSKPDVVRATLREYMAPSTALPAYQRVLEQQRTESPVDLGFIGSEAEVNDRLDDFADAGVTHLNPIVLAIDDDPGCGRRTRELLADRAGRLG